MERRGHIVGPGAGLLIALVALGACSSDPPLLDEHCVEPYRSLSLERRGLERRTERFVTGGARDGRVDVALHHVRRPGSRADRLVVLVHGVLASSSTWRFVVPELAATYDLLLVDLPGCGASDKPDPEQDPRAYGPDWLARRVATSLDAWSRRHGDRRPLTLVGHSLGGSVVLRIAASPVVRARHPGLFGRVTNLVLVSTPDVILTEPPEPIRKLAELEGLTAELGKVTGRLAYEVDGLIRDGRYHPERTALERDADLFTDVLADTATRRAGQAMLKRYTPWRTDGTLDVEAARRREAETAAVQVPTLVAWGAQDDVLGAERIAPLGDRIPGARKLVIPETRHSPQLEKPLVVAAAIEQFVGTP